MLFYVVFDEFGKRNLCDSCVFIKCVLNVLPRLVSRQFSNFNTIVIQLIFSGEYTKAMNQDWHSGHFCCWQCDESLTGQRYVLRDENPYCIKCYENVFANTCDECNKIIGIDSKVIIFQYYNHIYHYFYSTINLSNILSHAYFVSFCFHFIFVNKQDLSYKEKHWHEACFLCNKCRVSLVDKQFGSKAEKIYCGNCFDSQFASRCDGCGEVFRAGMYASIQLITHIT